MDFARSLWLMLFIGLISLCGMAPVSAAGLPSPQAGPARTSTAPATASSSLRAPRAAIRAEAIRADANQTLPCADWYSGQGLTACSLSEWEDLNAAALQAEYESDQSASYDPTWLGWQWNPKPSPVPIGQSSPYQTCWIYEAGLDCYAWAVTHNSAPNVPPYLPEKNLDPSCDCAGDPINPGMGSEYRDEADSNLGPLSFHRYYNSNGAITSTHIGSHWRHSFDRSLEYLSNGATSTATVFRPDGLQVAFTLQSGQWTTDTDVSDRLTTQTNASGVITGFLYFESSTRDQEAYDANGFLLSITNTHGQLTTLAYSTASTPTNVAPAAGLLLTVTDPRGRVLSFTYNSQGNVATVTQPDGGSLAYAYDTNGNLVTITYPDSKTRQYIYNESSLTGGTNLPNALTGDIDESGTRFTSIGYNSQGQATMSTLPSGVELTQVAYNSDGTTSITYPTGAQTTLNFVAPNGSLHTSTSSTPCGPTCDQPNASATFDANGYPTSHTDFKNVVTNTTYDVNGLLNQQVDAVRTADQRTNNTSWNASLRVPLTHAVLDSNGNTLAQTSWVYDAIGQPLARCEVDPSIAAAAAYTCATTGTVPAGVRRWVYTYCTTVNSTCPITGLLLTATGPRTDLTQTTTYSYYTTSSATSCGTPGSACHQAGDPYQIKDALGHLTTYASYDGAGRVTRITDANGVNTDMTYTPRGWLATRVYGGATTTFGYDAMGDVTSIKDPSGITTTFKYDAAHRLTDVLDAQSNDLHYTLDAAGNKTAEQTKTASGTVVRSLSRQFNTLGQLMALIDGLNKTVFNAGYSDSYDANGNLTHTADGLGVQRQMSFDALNRLNSTLDNYNGTDTATANTETVVAQDALDRVVGVGDPNHLNTAYTYDGLSNRTTLQSPDTGTSTDTFDAAGNRLVHTDARSVVSTSTYDALDRVLSTTYADASLNVAYSYGDSNTVTGCTSSKPINRLTRIVENTVTTDVCYDARGNVIQKNQVTSAQTDTTRYTYTAADRLATVTMPDKTVLAYGRNTNGLISTVKVTPSGASAASTVISATTWLPFGPISSYTLGNGQKVTRTYDANYRVTDIASPGFTLHLAHDLMGNVSAIGAAAGANPATETYQYDPLYRLGTVTEASGTTLESYTYNPTGDRLSKTASGLATGAYLYTTGTHQLQSIGNASQASDANGNTTGSVIGGGTYGFAYNGRNRLSLAQLNGSTVATYTYNALGQRIGKVTTTAERYAYNQSGQLLAEYGATNRDYLWMDDVPVAVVDNTINGSVTTSTINYITADQLNTPRAVTNSAGAVIWQWAYAGNPFGEKPPSSSSGYVLNLRYPGQYFDAETGLIHNDHRDYCAACGRYIESDPIGLDGGISTFTYGLNSPLRNVDPLGLESPRAASGCGTISWAACGALPPVIPTCTVPCGCNNSDAGKVLGAMGMIMAGGGPEDPLGDIAAWEEGGAALGDLTADEVGQIQGVVDQAGRPLDVVGSAANGSRTAASDIDYTTANANIENFEGLEGDLPGIDPEHGVLRGYADPNVGPSIRFEPGIRPFFSPGGP
ncbi:RHS repeat-associated protein [Rhodanobacter sp. ANJX3]|uniref:RHS repeat-associated core domain-containing protein n=1 Tax=Rhodanobacter sp. ANJX3 TaxID=2723083 RepID=UPI001617D790|nr:RHS repeat-associated core domain-containing protein [Rhodanobacter sp. ANJX3]MBB5356833.1 RHS repeat-associated protein [Rhodanobacter sp. ANJX3]